MQRPDTEGEYRNKLIRFPKELLDQLKILMIDHMSTTQETTTFTEYVLHLLRSYIKNTGKDLDKVQEDQIKYQVTRAEQVLTGGRCNRNVAQFWVKVLKKYRRDVKPDSPLDASVTKLLNGFMHKANPVIKKTITKETEQKRT